MLHPLIEMLREAFTDAADPEKAVAMKAYMKNQFAFAGLQKPVRSELQKSFLSEAKKLSWKEVSGIVRQLWKLPEREYQYVAMELLLAVKRNWGSDAFDLFIELICSKSWWDTVDMIAARMVGAVVSKDPTRYRKKILEFACEENFWLNRTALIHQLFYKDKTDTGLFEAVYLQCHQKKEFFVQKAIGWSLRQYSATDPDYVRSFAAKHSLSALARKEALRKING